MFTFALGVDMVTDRQTRMGVCIYVRLSRDVALFCRHTNADTDKGDLNNSYRLFRIISHPSSL